jgi:Zn-dependent alcohol dehydrogenase
MHCANPIIAIDTNPNKQGKSMAMGADAFVMPTSDDCALKMQSLLPNGADVIIDTTGNPTVITNMMQYLSGTGRLIMVAQPPPGMSVEIPSASRLFAGAGQTIKATQGGRTEPQRDIPRYINLYKAGKLRLDGVVTHRFSLDDINQAFDLLRTGDAGRIMINMKA